MTLKIPSLEDMQHLMESPRRNGKDGRVWIGMDLASKPDTCSVAVWRDGKLIGYQNPDGTIEYL